VHFYGDRFFKKYGLLGWDADALKAEMITNFSKEEGSLLLGNVGNQPILRKHRVGFQKNTVLRRSASKFIRAFICKITPYVMDWE